jgi:radical SAM-linked protein
VEARSGPGERPVAQAPNDAASAPGAARSIGLEAVPPRQRWRLVLSRSADAPQLGGRELTETWDAALEESELPFHRSAKPRPRITFAAPLPLGMAAEHELAEVFLAERWPLWRVRESLEGRVPPGWQLVDLFDVWVAGPPLAGRVTGAQYRVVLKGEIEQNRLRQSIEALMAARTLPRSRQKGDAIVPYDLRPLLWGIDLANSAPPLDLRIRTRIHPELGSGRPEEVVAALGESIGTALQIESIVRERIILADDEPKRKDIHG